MEVVHPLFSLSFFSTAKVPRVSHHQTGMVCANLCAFIVSVPPCLGCCGASLCIVQPKDAVASELSWDPMTFFVVFQSLVITESNESDFRVVGAPLKAVQSNGTAVCCSVV